MNAFMLLTWREWRRNRQIFLATLAIVPVMAVLLVVPSMRRGSTRAALINFAEVATQCSMLLGLFVAPLLAAHAVAGERADRSARFVASLPVSRGCRLSAKVAMVLALVLFLWAPFLSFLAFQTPDHAVIKVFGFLTTVTVVITAIAWLVAAWLDSVVLAAAVAIIVPIAVPLLFDVFAETTGLRGEGRKGVWVLWIGREGLPSLLTVLVAAACFAAGTVIYLRRTE